MDNCYTNVIVPPNFIKAVLSLAILNTDFDGPHAM